MSTEVKGCRALPGLHSPASLTTPSLLLFAPPRLPIRLSHDIADGCSIAQFLTALARASMNMSVPTPIIDRSLLLSAIQPSSPPPEAEEPKKPSGEMYPGYRAVSFFDRVTLVGAMMMSSSTSFIRMSFSRPELEAIKAAAMAPLEGTPHPDDGKAYTKVCSDGDDRRPLRPSLKGWIEGGVSVRWAEGSAAGPPILFTCLTASHLTSLSLNRGSQARRTGCRAATRWRHTCGR